MQESIALREHALQALHDSLSNPPAEHMFGCSSTELRDQPLESLVPEPVRASHALAIVKFGNARDADGRRY